MGRQHPHDPDIDPSDRRDLGNFPAVPTFTRQRASNSDIDEVVVTLSSPAPRSAPGILRPALPTLRPALPTLRPALPTLRPALAVAVCAALLTACTAGSPTSAGTSTSLGSTSTGSTSTSPGSASAQPTTGTSSTTTTSATTTPSATTPAGRQLAVSVTGRTITPAPAQVDLRVGESLTLTVTVDHDDLLHAHGFEIEKTLAAGAPTTIVLTGAEQGVYEVETHEPALTLLTIAVR